MLPILGHLPNEQDLQRLQSDINSLYGVTGVIEMPTLVDIISSLRSIIDDELTAMGLVLTPTVDNNQSKQHNVKLPFASFPLKKGEKAPETK